jgi:hypothetical protein
MSNPKFAAELDKIGISVAGIGGKFKPFPQLMGEIAQAMKGMTEVEAAHFLKDITKGAGGTIQALRGLFGALKDPDGVIAAVDAMSDSKGSFEEMYAIMADTPEAKILLLANAWKVFKETLGEALLPLITAIVEKITSLVNWFNELSPSTKKFIAYGILIASVFAIVIGVITALAGVFLILAGAVMMMTAITLPALLVAFSPVLVVLAAIAGAVAAVIGGFILFKAFTGKISGAMGYVAAVIGGLLTRLGLIPVAILAIIRNFDKIKTFFTQTIPQAVAALGGVLSRFFTQTIPGLFQGITNFFTNTLPTAVGAGLGAVGRFFTETIPRWTGMIISFFLGLPGRILGIMGEMVMNIATALGGAPASIAEALGFIIGYIIGFFITLPGRILDIFLMILTNLQSWGIQAGAWAARTAASIVNAIIRFFATLPGKIANLFATIWNGFVSWGGKTVSWAGRTAGSIVSAVIRFLASLPGKVASLFSKVYSTIVNWMSRMPGKAAEIASRVVSTISDWIGRIPGIIAGIFDRVVGVLQGMVGRAIEAAKNFGRGIWNGIKSGLGIGSPSHIERAFWSMESNVLATLERLKRQGPRIADNAARDINGAFSSFPALNEDLHGTMDAVRGNRTTVIEREDSEMARELAHMRELLLALLTRNPEFILEMDKHVLGKILKKKDIHDTRAKK